jgi:hypothetical protein
MLPSVPTRGLARPLREASCRLRPPRKFCLHRPAGSIRWLDYLASRARRVAGSVPSGRKLRCAPPSSSSARHPHSKMPTDFPEVRRACVGPYPSFRGSIPVGRKRRSRRPHGRTPLPARQVRQPARIPGSRPHRWLRFRSLASRSDHPEQASRVADLPPPVGPKTTARRPATTPDWHCCAPTSHSPLLLSTILRRP